MPAFQRYLIGHAGHQLAGGGDFGRLLRLDPAALTSQPNVSVAELSDASATQAAESHPTQALPVREEAAAAAPPPVQIMSSFGEARPLTDDGPRFLVDAMMGRLLRWLRVLGIDTLLREDGETIGEVFTRAHAEQRILLTRDRKLAENDHHYLFPVSDAFFWARGALPLQAPPDLWGLAPLLSPLVVRLFAGRLA